MREMVGNTAVPAIRYRNCLRGEGSSGALRCERLPSRL